MTTHPHALSNPQLAAELAAIEAALDADNARTGGVELLRREQAHIRRWMELRDEQRRRAALSVPEMII